MANKMIGIVGGIGSYAGIDLIRKIYDNSSATCDQEHLPVAMLSVPHSIVDRTDFILGKTNVNPGLAIANIITSLSHQGAEVFGIPCNTAHASEIYTTIRERAPAQGKIIHMVDEVAKEISSRNTAISKVGILGTSGTLSADVYSCALAKRGMKAIYPSEDIQNLFVHPAIYDRNYGLKAFSNPIKGRARESLMMALTHLIGRGAEAIVLGCTEIPLALPESEIEGVPLIDATTTLAKALIQASLDTKE